MRSNGNVSPAFTANSFFRFNCSITLTVLLGGDGDLHRLLEAPGYGRAPAVDAIVAHLLEKEAEEGLEVGSLGSLGGSGCPDDVDGKIEAGPGRNGVGFFAPQNLIYPKLGPVFRGGDVDFKGFFSLGMALWG